jgi:hypothetical protein
MQWCGKRASTIEAVISELSVPRSYLGDSWHHSAVEGSVVER